MRPLDGLRVLVSGDHPALRSAASILGILGAETVSSGAADLACTDDRILDDPVPDAGIPRGTVDHATGVLLAGACLLDASAVVDRRLVATHLYLPQLMGGDPPSAPLAAGSGYVCADLTADGDQDAFGRLLDTLGDGAGDPERLAAAAQEWRLPVTPYRPRRTTACGPAIVPCGGGGVLHCRRGPMKVVDLTVMWSGPLATWLLAGLGAEVVKIEPECRLDGMRRSPTRMFEALHRGKHRIDLDLRTEPDRREFLRLVADADVVIDNFSPRVRGNLAIDHERLRALNPNLVSISMPAFAPGSRERDWVSYGTGVHAISGLGDLSNLASVVAAAPRVTYPDPVAGITAFTTAAAYLRGGMSGHVEVPLRSAIEPLVEVDDGSCLLGPVPDLALSGLPDHPVRA